MTAVSTVTRWDVCQEAMARCRVSRCLEIGVGIGRAGRLLRAETLIGVDPVLPVKVTGYTAVHSLPSDVFFEQQRTPPLGAILIDGDHECGQVLRDVVHSLDRLADGGTLVVHDANPMTERSQVSPRPAGQLQWHGDVWKAIVILRATRPDLQVVTLDADEGLGIIRRAARPQPLLVAPLGALTWAGLVAHRAQWLGLVDTW